VTVGDQLSAPVVVGVDIRVSGGCAGNTSHDEGGQRGVVIVAGHQPIRHGHVYLEKALQGAIRLPARMAPVTSRRFNGHVCTSTLRARAVPMIAVSSRADQSTRGRAASTAVTFDPDHGGASREMLLNRKPAWRQGVSGGGSWPDA
jgi:hypothetical protein